MPLRAFENTCAIIRGVNSLRYLVFGERFTLILTFPRQEGRDYFRCAYTSERGEAIVMTHYSPSRSV